MAKNKLKIAFLLSQFPETHETFILREFVGMQARGLDFEIYSLKKCRDKIIHPQAKQFGARTFYTPVLCIASFFYWLIFHPVRFFKADMCVYRYLFDPINFIKAKAVFLRSLYFARIMKKNKITHIHAHWATMPAAGAEVISTLLGIPFSFTAHAWDIFLSSKKSLLGKVKRAEFVVTCTKFNKVYIDRLLNEGHQYPWIPGYISDKIIVNYHGLDLDEFSLREERPRADNVIFAVGRLVEQKGFEYLIRACGILHRKSIDFRCVIAGEGPLRKHFEDIIDNLGLKGYVELPGTVSLSRIENWFQKASVFAAPSVVAGNGDRDGIPNVILEAMAVGVPVVTSDVSGIPEVVVDQETGIVVPPGQERSLASALEYVLNKKGLLNDLKLNARRKVEEEFDIEKNVEKLIVILRRS